MYSVTQRIKMIQQPKGGYIPVGLFDEVQFWDEEQICEVTSGVKAIQGMAVDYLTRFLLGQPKENAFSVSIEGARIVAEEKKAYKLLECIRELDRQSIFCACKLVGYDVAYRRGANCFTEIKDESISQELISNIYVMVNRSLTFLKKYGPVTMCGFTLEGGYNWIISRGDGDYLLKDTLLDFKTSTNPLNSKQTLQLAIYYVMGVHSIYAEFRNIKKLGVFNPLLNKAYFANIEDIEDSVFTSISRNVVGYRFYDNDYNWKKAHGTDFEIFKECVEQYKITGFSPTDYEDGIHEISFDDYWSYSFVQSGLSSERPSFSRSEKIIMLKNNGFYMFVSMSRKKSLSLMHGGQLKKLEKPVQYYYDRLPEYGNCVLKSFSAYWNALYSLSDFLRSIRSTGEKKALTYTNEAGLQLNGSSVRLDDTFGIPVRMQKCGFDGRVHGCIVDLDFFNHIFLNPFDGAVVPYHALSTSDKYIYRDVKSLLRAQRPEMIDAYVKKINLLKDNSPLLMPDFLKVQNNLMEKLQPYEIENIPQNKDGYFCTDEYMYYISGIFKRLQPIYDNHVVTTWYDNLLPPCEKEYTTEDVASILGQSAEMTCGMKATVIEDYGAKNISVQFEDGTVVKGITRRKFKNRTVINPNVIPVIEKKKKDIGNEKKKSSYVGQTKRMNSGHIATVVEDFGCNDITIRFEDGVIRKHCRRDKFREGKIGYTKG